MRKRMRQFMSGIALAVVAAPLAPGIAVGHADNKRLNDGVVSNVYTVQRQAAQRHATTD